MAASSQRGRKSAALKIVDPFDLVTDASESLPAATSRGYEASSLPLAVAEGAGDFLEASIAEDGGPEGMPVRRGSQHQYRAVLHQAIVRVAEAMDTHGVCDRQGRLRRSWLSGLEGLIREARALDEMLGPERVEIRSAPAADAKHVKPAIAEPGRLPRDIEDFFERMDDEH